MSYSIIIPARYASTRFPGKPLASLAGKPMLQHVFECAQKSQAKNIIIATDDKRIEETALAFGADVCMTAETHQSGTERIHEVLEKLGFKDNEIIVNLQGDEPLMPSACLDQVADLLSKDKQAVMATLAEAITEPGDIFNSNIVKVISDNNQHALYFSRAPIPWQRGQFENNSTDMKINFNWQRHIGLYAYRAGFIREYINLAPSPIETIESLEQLRVLWHGFKIAIAEAVEKPGPGIDTEEELKKAEQLLT